MKKRTLRLYVGVLAASAMMLLASVARADVATITRPDPTGKPTKVSVWVFLLDLDEINSAEQSIKVNLFVALQWHDPRLANESGRRQTYNLDEVWHPKLVLVNRQRGWDTFSESVLVDPDGTVTYRRRYYGDLSTPLNLRDFPLDSHWFEIRFAAPGYHSDKIEFYLNPEHADIGRADHLSLADWRVSQWRSYPSDYEPIKGEPSIAGFVFEFEARRLAGFFLVKVFVPFLLIVLMSWAVFWIDPQHIGAQISVSITSMLTLIAYQFVLANLLPRLPYVTRLDQFMLGSTILVFLALVEVVVTSHLATEERIVRARLIDRLSRVAFPVLFILLIVLSFVV